MSGLPGPWGRSQEVKPCGCIVSVMWRKTGIEVVLETPCGEHAPECLKVALASAPSLREWCERRAEHKESQAQRAGRRNWPEGEILADDAAKLRELLDETLPLLAEFLAAKLSPAEAPPTAAQEAWLVYDNVRGEYLTTGDSLALFADMATAYRAAERWAVDRCSDDPWRFQPHRAALARQEEP